MASKLPMRPIRIEDGLYNKICYIANLEERSYNAEVTYILKCFIQQFEDKHGPIQLPVPSRQEST